MTVNNDIIIQLSERVAVLETEIVAMKSGQTDIVAKLDSLLELKAKGMGAVGLASLVIGSGLLGLIAMLFSFFKGGSVHL